MCEARLQASPRGVRKPRSGWRDLRVCEAHLQASPRGVVKKTIPQSACADSSLYTKEPENSPITEVSFAFCEPRLCRVLRLPCVKGAPPQAVRDGFFTLQPLPRFPNPSRRRLQACFAHLQIPLHKGAFFELNRAAGVPLLSYLLLSLISAKRLF